MSGSRQHVLLRAVRGTEWNKLAKLGVQLGVQQGVRMACEGVVCACEREYGWDGAWELRSVEPERERGTVCTRPSNQEEARTDVGGWGELESRATE